MTVEENKQSDSSAMSVLLREAQGLGGYRVVITTITADV